MTQEKSALEGGNPARDSGKPPVTVGTEEHHAMAPLPDNALVIVPVRNMVLFPGMLVPITIGRESTIAAAQYAIKAGLPIGILMQRSAEVESPEPGDLFDIGTRASIIRYVTTQDGALLVDRSPAVMPPRQRRGGFGGGGG